MRISLSVVLAAALVQNVRTAGPFGVDAGFLLDYDGTILITSAHAQMIADAGTGWVRVDFHPVGNSSLWDATMLGLYDQAVGTLLVTGLQVYGLMGPGMVPGGQDAWNANSFEIEGGNGNNTYIEDYAYYGGIIASHFADRIASWELFNEPNAWTSSGPNGTYSGGTWIYPSNYVALLAAAYAALKGPAPGGRNLTALTLYSGGVFGTSAWGFDFYHSGAAYISWVYDWGVHGNYTDSFKGVTYYSPDVHPFADVKASMGTYPLDGCAQHIYIDQGGATSGDRVLTYIGYVRQAYAAFEGTDTTKTSIITEMGWTTDQVTPAQQAANLNASLGAIRSALDPASGPAAVPYLAITTWFQFEDNGAGLSYGLVDLTWSPKASYAGFTALAPFEGAWANGSVHSLILRYYVQSGGQLALGNPALLRGAGPFVHAATSALGSIAALQHFTGGACGDLSLIGTGAGTVCELNSVREFWAAYWAAVASGARVGWPIANAHTVGDGLRQDLEAGGYLFWDAVNGTVVHAAPSY